MATNEELKDQLDLIENKIDSNDGYIKEVFNKNIELVSPIAQDVDLGNGVVLPNLKKLMDEIDDIVMQKMLETGVQIPTQQELDALILQVVTEKVGEIELPETVTTQQVTTIATDITNSIIANYSSNMQLVTRPVITYPLNGTIGFVGGITIAPYVKSSYFKGELDYVRAETATDREFTNIVHTKDDGVFFEYTPPLAPLTQFFTRFYFGSDNHLSAASEVVSYTTSEADIITPTIISPINDSVIDGKKVTITTSEYTTLGHNEPQTYMTVQIATDSAFTNIVEESVQDTVNLTSYTSGDLESDKTHYARVLKGSASYESVYSPIVEFKTPAISIVKPIISALPETINSLKVTINTDEYTTVGHNEPQTYMTVQIATDSAFTNIVEESVQDTVNLTSYTSGDLESDKTHYARVLKGSASYESVYSPIVEFKTPIAGIYKPNIISPLNGVSEIGKQVTITTDTYAAMNHSEPQTYSKIQIAKDKAFTIIIEERLNDTVNLTSYTSEDLETNTTYYVRWAKGSKNYESDYSDDISFTTKSQFTISAGIQGTKGFSVAPTDQPFALLGLAEMTGTNDPASDNYGNYIHTNGSIVCWLPKTFIRVGHPDSPRFATYGENALDIEGTDVFATEVEANASGYALPRCFINGGKEQPGVFVDKYMNSKDGTTASKSVFGGVPISLATTAGFTFSNGMTGCTGILADAVVLSKARGERWNATSAFIYGYLALVSVAQAQAATSTADVAWYDPTGVKNYPKGCNNGTLSDVDDTTVVYASAGDSGDANKPKTGATANFAKTTHNGSNNGVADLNGGIWEVTIGITNFGSSETATTAITNDSIYVLKHSTDIATLTAGWNGATDVWGDAANLATKYDSVTSPHPLGSSTGTVYWGNGTNAVLQNDLNGVNRDICGFIPKNSSSTGATGANLFGNDQLNKNNRQNMVPLACGSWSDSAYAGVFSRYFSARRSNSGYTYGFRASAYFA